MGTFLDNPRATPLTTNAQKADKEYKGEKNL